MRLVLRPQKIAKLRQDFRGEDVTKLQDYTTARLQELGKGPVEAATAVGLPRNFIRDLVAARKASIRSDRVVLFAQALETSVDRIEALMRGQGDTVEAGPTSHGIGHSESGTSSSQPPVTTLASPSAVPTADLVPVLGVAYGSVIANSFSGLVINSDPIEYIARPPALQGARDIYAVFISGESMSPQHSPGELRFVSPHRPATPGDTVIVQTRVWDDDPGQAYIKLLIRRHGGFLELRQINPEATIKIPEKYVRSVHRVLTTRELFGI